MQSNIVTFFAAALVVGGLSAQTYHYAPFGYDTFEGTSNNTIPFWAQSGVYQQVHDASDLTNVFGSSVASITSINIRKDGVSATAIAARSMDVEISLGHTSASAATISTIFANNLGPAPSTVLPYTNVNLPALSNVSLPNPIGWQFPFATPFTYTAPQGNLCWELRFRNNTSTATAPFDAATATSAAVNTPIGSGCVATGQTLPAVIDTRSLTISNGNYRNRLNRAAANAPAALFIGFQQQQISLPGMCSSLEFFPLADVPGSTDASGMWDLTISFGSLVGLPSVDIYGQYVFLDAGLPYSLGVSNASWATLPLPTVMHVSRAYLAPSSGGPGNETATSGSIGASYGLVTAFGQ